jgi:hypothetical protein
MRSARIVFWVYLTFITAGLAYAIAVGLLGH